MKRKYIYIVGCLLSFIGMIGCEDMDDNYKQYLEPVKLRQCGVILDSNGWHWPGITRKIKSQNIF